MEPEGSLPCSQEHQFQSPVQYFIISYLKCYTGLYNWSSCEHSNGPMGSMKGREFLD